MNEQSSAPTAPVCRPRRPPSARVLYSRVLKLATGTAAGNPASFPGGTEPQRVGQSVRSDYPIGAQQDRLRDRVVGANDRFPELVYDRLGSLQSGRSETQVVPPFR